MKVVAAENFYGDVASQIGGANVAVTSILTNPDQDPHLFEASADTAKALADAKVVIVNGVDYDPWMEKLLSANKAPGRKEIVVAQLVGRKAGDNPHLWYDPGYVKAAAKALTADLDAIDPAHKADYDKGEAQFLDSLKPLDAKIADMRKKYAGQPVIASEPVFGYQAGLIGLKVHNEKFALAVMNNAEPTASEVAAFENDLKGHKVKAMLYNAQASEPAVAASGADGQGQRHSRRRRLRDRAAGLDLSAVDARATRRARRRARRRGQVSALRFDNVTIRLGGRDILSAASFARRGRRIHRHARRQRRRQDHADARRARPDAGRVRRDQRSRSARHARKFIDRLHAAEPRARAGPASDRLRRRRQRGDRRALRLRAARQGDAARNRLGARSRRRARLWRAARSASSRAASASACC